MIKKCVVKNGKILHVGEWDYQKAMVQVGEDEEGNPVLEEQITNPFPGGAETQDVEMEHDPDRGWYEAGEVKTLTDKERLEEMELLMADLLIEKMGVE